MEIQFNSVTQSCLTPCDPMDCSMPGFPVHHQLPKLAQTHIHWEGNGRPLQYSCLENPMNSMKRQNGNWYLSKLLYSQQNNERNEVQWTMNDQALSPAQEYECKRLTSNRKYSWPLHHPPISMTMRGCLDDKYISHRLREPPAERPLRDVNHFLAGTTTGLKKPLTTWNIL